MINPFNNAYPKVYYLKINYLKFIHLSPKGKK